MISQFKAVHAVLIHLDAQGQGHGKALLTELSEKHPASTGVGLDTVNVPMWRLPSISVPLDCQWKGRRASEGTKALLSLMEGWT
jgi:hypothetical protein